MEKHKLTTGRRMGTMLQRRAGARRCPRRSLSPTRMSHRHPRAYIAAGSEIIYANTFGGNRYKVRGQRYTVPRGEAASLRPQAPPRHNCARGIGRGALGQLLELRPLRSTRPIYLPGDAHRARPPTDLVPL